MKRLVMDGLAVSTAHDATRRARNSGCVMRHLATISLLILFGCATSTQKLQQISLGMDKKQVEENIGNPSAVRGAIQNKFGQTIEVWEYELSLPSKNSAGQIVGKTMITLVTIGIGAIMFKGEKKKYWLYFVNDRLGRWGEAGDWGRESDHIYEIKFNSSEKLKE